MSSILRSNPTVNSRFHPCFSPYTRRITRSWEQYQCTRNIVLIVQFCQMKITARSRLHSGFLSVLLWCHGLFCTYETTRFFWIIISSLQPMWTKTRSTGTSNWHGRKPKNKKQTLHGDACTHQFVHEQTAVHKEVFSQSVRCRTRAVIQTRVFPQYFPGGLKWSKIRRQWGGTVGGFFYPQKIACNSLCVA